MKTLGARRNLFVHQEKQLTRSRSQSQLPSPSAPVTPATPTCPALTPTTADCPDFVTPLSYRASPRLSSTRSVCSLGAPSLLRSLLESQTRAETPVVPQNTAEEEEDDGAGAVKGVLGTRGLTPLSGRARAALLRSHGVQQQQQQDAEQVITPSSLPLYLCNPG